MFGQLKEVFMQRVIFTTIAVLATLVLAMSAAWAGNAHFTTVDVNREGDTLCASGKEAGLGDEPFVDIELKATANCINPGSNKPKAANKQSVSAEGSFPVQNGKALFGTEFGEAALCVTASFQPDCSPPMTVTFTNVSVCDISQTPDVCASVPGTF
jgi:hypothetical protein